MKTASKRETAPSIPPAQTDTATEIRKADAKPSPTLSKLARQVYASVKDNLESKLEDFLEGSTLEEQRFMIAVMDDWDGRSVHGRPLSLSEYEVPIYGAIQTQFDGKLCVVVPNSEMMPAVEEFILELRRGRYKKPAYSPGGKDALRDRWEESFRSEVDLFARDAGLPSFLLMHNILARWNEIYRDPEIGKVPNTLAVAAEMELDKYRARAAAEAAAKAKD